MSKEASGREAEGVDDKASTARRPIEPAPPPRTWPRRAFLGSLMAVPGPLLLAACGGGTDEGLADTAAADPAAAAAGTGDARQTAQAVRIVRPPAPRPAPAPAPKPAPSPAPKPTPAPPAPAPAPAPAPVAPAPKPAPPAPTPAPPAPTPTPPAPTPAPPAPAPAPPAPTPAPPAPAPAGWSMPQSVTKRWDMGAAGWTGGNSLTLSNVKAGSTLVLCVWGYISSAGQPFASPVDSMGQAIQVAVDAGVDPRVPAGSKAWILHNAKAGTHTWTNLPAFPYGDGCAFLVEFSNGGVPSTQVIGAAFNTLSATKAPWLTTGSVTMSAPAAAGDLLVAFSFEEEFSIGQAFTPYTDPPANWNSIGSHHQSILNISGAACWRRAPDATRQTVAWTWTPTGGQDPTLFKGIIFAVR